MLMGQMWGALRAQRRTPPPYLGIRGGFLEEVTQKLKLKKQVEMGQLAACLCVWCGREGQCQESVPRRGGGRSATWRRRAFGGTCWAQDGTGPGNRKWERQPPALVPASPTGTSCGCPRGSEPPSHDGAEACQGCPSPTVRWALPTVRTALRCAVSLGLCTVEDNFSGSCKLKTIKAPTLKIVVGIK